MKQQEFELKLADGKSVTWVGSDGVNAAERYADTFPQSKVIAWRCPRTDIVVGPIAIIE